MMNGVRSQLTIMMAFCIVRSSEGSPAAFQLNSSLSFDSARAKSNFRRPVSRCQMRVARARTFSSDLPRYVT